MHCTKGQRVKGGGGSAKRKLGEKQFARSFVWRERERNVRDRLHRRLLRSSTKRVRDSCSDHTCDLNRRQSKLVGLSPKRSSRERGGKGSMKFTKVRRKRLFRQEASDTVSVNVQTHIVKGRECGGEKGLTKSSFTLRSDDAGNENGNGNQSP